MNFMNRGILKNGISAIVPLALYEPNFYPNFVSTINKNIDKVEEVVIVNDTLPQEIPKHPKIKFVATFNKAASVIFNKGVENCSCEYYFFMPAGVILNSNITKEILRWDKGKTGLLFSDYYSETENKLVTLFDYNGDITERFNFGFLEIYKKSVWQKLKKYNIDYSTDIATHYDFKLRMKQYNYKFLHIKNPLYRVLKDEKISSLFSVFRYLNYSPQEEKEIETVFYNFLQTTGCFLSHKNYKIRYPKGEKFSPLVSIVSATYNREKWVSKAIESVIENNFQDWELIFVDNASTDNTSSIIQKYAQKDKRIRLIQLPKYQEAAIAHCLNIRNKICPR